MHGGHHHSATRPCLAHLVPRRRPFLPGEFLLQVVFNLLLQLLHLGLGVRLVRQPRTTYTEVVVALHTTLNDRHEEVTVTKGIHVDPLNGSVVDLVVEHHFPSVLVVVVLLGVVHSWVVVVVGVVFVRWSLSSPVLVLASPVLPPPPTTHILGRPRRRDVGVVKVALLVVLAGENGA